MMLSFFVHESCNLLIIPTGNASISRSVIRVRMESSGITYLSVNPSEILLFWERPVHVYTKTNHIGNTRQKVKYQPMVNHLGTTLFV